MKKHLLILLLLLLLLGCEKAFIDPQPDNDPVTNFEVLWETVDLKYSFFALKEVDWDSIYHVYRPQVHAEMGPVELFDVMAAMLNELEDGHVNLVSPFDRSRYWDWSLNSPENFNFSVIERNYLEPEYRITGPFWNTVIDSVGYIYYGSFSSGFDTTQLDLLIRTFSQYKGLIFDVRNNGGGMVSNAFTIASRFADEELVTYYEQFRNGREHDDFTELYPRFVRPAETQYKKPVVVLTNRSSYSATNDFVAIMRNFPQVTILGDTTGGGGGLPGDYDLPNGWRFRFSTSQSFTPDGLNMEPGIPPDEYVAIDPQDEIRGVDTIIEEALELLR